MARLHNFPRFTGTRDGICIYYMRGSFFVPAASSLTAERVKKDPAFAETRRNSSLMSRAAKISSAIHKEIRGKKKTRETYRLLTGEVTRMLRNGQEEQEISRILSAWYV